MHSILIKLIPVWLGQLAVSPGCLPALQSLHLCIQLSAVSSIGWFAHPACHALKPVIVLQIIRMIFEVKNELYSTNSDAFFEGIFNFATFLTTGERAAETSDKRCSAFVVTLEGPWIW